LTCVSEDKGEFLDEGKTDTIRMPNNAIMSRNQSMLLIVGSPVIFMFYTKFTIY
jgi:hypothetical protein